MMNRKNILAALLVVMGSALSLCQSALAGEWEVICEVAPGNHRSWYRYSLFNEYTNRLMAPTRRSMRNTATVRLGRSVQLADSYFPGVSSATPSGRFANGEYYMSCTINRKIKWVHDPYDPGSNTPAKREKPPKLVAILEKSTANASCVIHDGNSLDFLACSSILNTGHGSTGSTLTTNQNSVNPFNPSHTTWRTKIIRVDDKINENNEIDLGSITISSRLSCSRREGGAQFEAQGTLEINAYSIDATFPVPYRTIPYLFGQQSGEAIQGECLPIFPSPNPAPVPSTVVNQYVAGQSMQDVFNQIQCVVRLFDDPHGDMHGTLGIANDYVKSRLSWTMERPFPKEFPSAQNIVDVDQQGEFVKRTYWTNFPDPPIYPTSGDGFAFDTRAASAPDTGRLPASNGEFGVRWVSHKFDGEEFDKSKIAIFYEANASTHPEGGPPGYEYNYTLGGESNTLVNTPNWFYYYSQAYPGPREVVYVNRGGLTFGYVSDGHPHIHMCRTEVEYNGNMQVCPTLLFAKQTGANLLQIVGIEESRGIDAYARILQHEHSHKRCAEFLSEGNLDQDDDGVPDVWEAAVGLIVDPDDVNPQDSTGLVDQFPNTFEENDASGDEEAFVRMCERGIDGDVDKDWASNGLNANVPPPNRFERHPRRSLDNGPPVNLDQLIWPTLPQI